MAPLARITSGPSGYGVLLVAHRTFHYITTIIRFHVIEICFDGRVQKYFDVVTLLFFHPHAMHYC